MAKLNFTFLKQLPAHEKKITVSTVITCVRILLIPCIMIAIIKALWGTANILFVGAIITDMLDGYLARRWHEKTFLGACLDPLADKLLLITVFCTLGYIPMSACVVPWWFISVIIGKELLLVVGVVLLSVFGRIEISPTLLGKVTTIVQMGFVQLLLLCCWIQWFPVQLYYGVLIIVLSMVFASLLHYGYIGMRLLLYSM